MTRTRGWRALVATAAAVVMGGAALAAGAPPVHAQSTQSDARWQPWIGCWEPAAEGYTLGGGGAAGPRTCVLPAAGRSAVEIATVDSGQVVARRTIVADGQPVASSESGCNGSRVAQWSSDGERVYLRAKYTCQGGVQRSSSELMAMTPNGEWLDVQSIAAGKSAGVHVQRYGQAPVPASLSAQVAVAAPSDEALGRGAAQVVAAAPLTVGAVEDASKHVSAATVEAWLIALKPSIQVDGNDLLRLANAHVPKRVIDAMVALSYPQRFAIASPQNVGRRSAPGAGAMYGGQIPVQMLMVDPFLYDPYGFDPYGLNPYGYGYSPYGYGYSQGVGFGAGWYYGGGPTIILQSPPSLPHGTAVNGHGYTEGSNQGSNAQPDGRSGGGSPPPPPQPQYTGRTAKPRPPM